MPLSAQNPFTAFNTDQAAAVSDAGSQQIDAFEKQQQDAANNVSAWDTTKAAFDSNNLIGSAIYRYNHPKPDGETPGFDALDHIPAGYETQADYFATATSQAEVDWRRQYLDHTNEMKGIISANPKLGFAASLASGLVDPVNIASMFIPIAGETRLARFGYSAFQMAATASAQEAIQHQLDPTRTGDESAWNISTSALLGGVIGAAIRPRVPGKVFNDLAEKARIDPEGALGDPTVRVLNDVPPDLHIPPIKEEPMVPREKIPTEYRIDEEGNHIVTSPNGISIARLRGNKLQEIGTETIPEAQGKGEATARAQRLIDEAQNLNASYVSDTQVSSAAAKMYDRLERQGYQVTRNPASLDELGENLKSDNGQPVFEVFQPKELNVPPEAFGHVNMGESTVGAAAVHQPTLQEERVAKGAQTITEGPLGQITPGGRLLSSPFLSTRRIVQRLGNIGPKLEKNFQGEATAIPVERKIWNAEGVWGKSLDERNALYKQYRQRVIQAGEEKLSRNEWDAAVSHAMRNGDKSDIPEIAQAAKATRERLINPYFTRAQKLAAEGAIKMPEETNLYAESYLLRQADPVKIRNDMEGFLNAVKGHYIGEGMDPAEAGGVAHHIMRSYLGSERGMMDWTMPEGAVAQTGRLKGRTVTVPDNVLEPWLNSDIDSLTHSYLRSMAPTVETAEEFGSIGMKDQLQEIKDESSRMIERALAKGDTKTANELEKRAAKDIKDLEAVRDRLYGTYGQPKDPGNFFVRAGRLLRSNNVVRLLGGATISHIPDVANVISRYGLKNTIAATSKLATSLDAIKLTRAEAHRFGLGLDMAMNTVSMLGDFGSHSKYAEQRFMSKLTRGFTIATGETPLITGMQMWASLIGQDELLRNAEKVAAGQDLSKNTMSRLLSAGLDKPMLQRIAAQHTQFGREVSGLKFGMSDLWKDRAAQVAFETAILKDAHSVTLRPGVLDSPLTMSTEAGKLIFQFKSFAFAAQQSVVLPSLQGIAHADPRVISGILAMVAGGTASYVLHQKGAGQPIETENPGRFALEVLDKSNLTGWMGSAIFPSLWENGFKSLSRWSDTDPAETIGGPSVGTLFSTYERRFPAKAVGDPNDPSNQFKRSDLHFIRRTFLPGQNLWWARRGINDAEDAIGDAFDLPGTSNKERLEQ